MHDGEKSVMARATLMAWWAGLWPAGCLLHTPALKHIKCNIIEFFLVSN